MNVTNRSPIYCQIRLIPWIVGLLTLCGSQALAQTWTLAFTKGPFNWTESCIRQNLAVTLNVYNGGTPQQPLQRWDYVVTDNGYVAPTGSAHFLYAGVANFKLHFPAAIPGVASWTWTRTACESARW